jgi:hypothetical protein
VSVSERNNNRWVRTLTFSPSTSDHRIFELGGESDEGLAGLPDLEPPRDRGTSMRSGPTASNWGLGGVRSCPVVEVSPEPFFPLEVVNEV